MNGRLKMFPTDSCLSFCCFSRGCLQRVQEIEIPTDYKRELGLVQIETTQSLHLGHSRQRTNGLSHLPQAIDTTSSVVLCRFRIPIYEFRRRTCDWCTVHCDIDRPTKWVSLTDHRFNWSRMNRLTVLTDHTYPATHKAMELTRDNVLGTRPTQCNSLGTLSPTCPPARYPLQSRALPI